MMEETVQPIQASPLQVVRDLLAAAERKIDEGRRLTAEGVAERDRIYAELAGLLPPQHGEETPPEDEAQAVRKRAVVSDEPAEAIRKKAKTLVQPGEHVTLTDLTQRLLRAEVIRRNNPAAVAAALEESSLHLDETRGYFVGEPPAPVALAAE